MLSFNKKIIIIISLVFFPSYIFAITFKKAVLIIDKHPSISAIKHDANALKYLSSIKGSTGDPVFSIAAKNFLIKSFRTDKFPMTGLEVGVSKKIPLSTKYSNQKYAILAKAKAKFLESKNHKQKLLKKLWIFLIQKKRIEKEKFIITKNLLWIKNMLRVSQKLYSNGKLSQPALFDIQIRKAELETQISNNQFSYNQILNKIGYLLNFKKQSIISKSIPWNILYKVSAKSIKKDYKKMRLQSLVLENKYNLTAKKLNYIPDLKLSLSVTKRHKVHPHGDLISLSASFPLPFSAKKYSQHGRALQKKYSAINNLNNYTVKKERNILLLNNTINKIKKELSILNKKSIRFAKSYRTITAKSYTLGRATYVEMLQSELKLQKISLQKIFLEEKKDTNMLSLKYILGEKLYE
ncbi:MAG: TolC family protein [Bdellovibrionales bacterium]|nr:TolC family protein [Bdellovibrionales bacterium]